MVAEAATVRASALAAITPNMFAALVVVDVDNIDAELIGGFNRSQCADPVVDGNDQLDTLGRECTHRVGFDAVAFGESIW